VKRRNFVKYALIAAAAGTPFLQCKESSLEKKLSLPQALTRIYDEKTITEIGQAYRKMVPGEYNLQKLETLLKENAEGKKLTSNTSFAEVNEILDKKVQTDFVRGETVIVSGYVLSITEARQCALFTLLNKQ
jgi:hypothetical protein